LTVGALKELLYQAVTLGFAEESADVLTQQMFGFLGGGYPRFRASDAKESKKPVSAEPISGRPRNNR